MPLFPLWVIISSLLISLHLVMMKRTKVLEQEAAHTPFKTHQTETEKAETI